MPSPQAQVSAPVSPTNSCQQAPGPWGSRAENWLHGKVDTRTRTHRRLLTQPAHLLTRARPRGHRAPQVQAGTPDLGPARKARHPSAQRPDPLLMRAAATWDSDTAPSPASTTPWPAQQVAGPGMQGADCDPQNYSQQLPE